MQHDIELTDKEKRQIIEQRQAARAQAKDIARANLLADFDILNDARLCAPYPRITEPITEIELNAIKTIQETARTLPGTHGMPIVSHIQPPLALAIIRRLRKEWDLE
jgi:hypothetical protein